MTKTVVFVSKTVDFGVFVYKAVDFSVLAKPLLSVGSFRDSGTLNTGFWTLIPGFGT